MFNRAIILLLIFNWSLALDAHKMAVLDSICVANFRVDMQVYETVAKEMLLKSTEKNDTFYEAVAYNHLGTAYQFKAILDSAVYCHKEAIANFIQLKSTQSLASSYKLLGNAYYRKGKYDSTILQYQKALKIAEELQDVSLQSSLSHNMGVVSLRIPDLMRGRAYFKNSLKLKKQLNDTNGIINTTISLANSFHREKKLDSCLHYYFQGLKWMNNNVPKNIQFNILSNISLVYHQMDQNDNSLVFAEKLKPLLPFLNDYNDIFSYHHRLGFCYFLDGQKKYLSHFDSMLAMSKRYENNQFKNDAYDAMFRHHYKTGNFKLGDFYLDKFSRIQDSLRFNSLSEKAIEAQEKFDTEKIELNNKSLKAEKRASRVTIYWLISVLITLLFLGLVIALWLKNASKKKLIQFNEKLVESNLKAEVQERHRIARELHDGLGQKITAIKLQLENGKDDEKFELHEAIKQVNDLSMNVREISHQMVPISLQRFGFIQAVEGLAMKRSPEVKVEFFNLFDNKFKQDVALQLYRCIQELLNNALKHSDASLINIQGYLQKDNLFIHIEDNGKGMPKEENFSRGIGMQSIKKRLDSINGILDFKSSSEGTSFQIKIQNASKNVLV